MLSVVPSVVLSVVFMTHRSDTIVEKHWPIRTIIIVIHHVFVNVGTKWKCILDHFYFKLFNRGIFDLFGSRLTSALGDVRSKSEVFNQGS